MNSEIEQAILHFVDFVKKKGIIIRPDPKLFDCLLGMIENDIFSIWTDSWAEDLLEQTLQSEKEVEWIDLKSGPLVLFQIDDLTEFKILPCCPQCEREVAIWLAGRVCFRHRWSPFRSHGLTTYCCGWCPYARNSRNPKNKDRWHCDGCEIFDYKSILSGNRYQYDPESDGPDKRSFKMTETIEKKVLWASHLTREYNQILTALSLPKKHKDWPKILKQEFPFDWEKNKRDFQFTIEKTDAFNDLNALAHEGIWACRYRRNWMDDTTHKRSLTIFVSNVPVKRRYRR